MRVGLLSCLALVLCFSIFAPPLAGEPVLTPEDYAVRIWGTASGLPDNSVRTIVRTGDGYLWLGTSAGLVRFDGARFTIFNQWNTPQMKDGRILSMYEDAGHTLWVGTDGGGLCAYGAGEWRSFEEAEGLPDGHIRAVAQDRDGALWLGTEYGLHSLNGVGTSSYGLDEGLVDDLVTALALDGFGRLWAGTMWGGLARFEDGLVHVYGINDGLGDERVLSLHADSMGSLWIGTMSGLFCLRPQEKEIRTIAGTEAFPVTALASWTGGRLLIGTMTGGLKILSDDGLTDFFLGDEFEDCHVRAVLADGYGCIWIGTDSRSLIELREREVGSIGHQAGLPEGSVYAIMEDPDGTLWVGTENSGLFRMSDGRVTGSMDRSSGLAGNMVRVLSRDRFGRLLVGTRDGGLSIVENGRIENLTTKDGLSSDNITAVLCDGTGAAWVGTDRGLYRSLDGKVENASPVAGFEGRTIRTLHESEEEILYVGTRRGLWKLAGADIEMLQTGNEKPELDVLSLSEDSLGGLWIGTNGSGLARLSEQEITTYTTEDGLPGNFIFSVTEGDSSRLWMSCEAGVFTISGDSLIAYMEGGSGILAPTLYDESEGMPSGRCNGNCYPAVCKSAFGKWYYPTNAGIAVFERDRPARPAKPPVPHIESITAGEAVFAADDDIRLKHTAGTVEIRFTAIDYFAPGKCRFLYRLKEHDSGFTAIHPHQERKAVYRKLPPGEYEFTVTAISNGGLWSENAASAGFVVAASFYQTSTFLFILIAAVLLAGGAGAAHIRYRRNRKQRMKYSTSTISEDRMDKVFAELNTLMAEEKIYLDPDLTLKKLAERLHVHYNHISRIINEKYGSSFNNYINRYRVEEAQRRLADPELGKKNILEIMYDVGFYSKSTFNTAFKKFAGCSPSEYRRKHTRRV
jgi:ligand-binding sensor domain-containing protein/AraC-like DNA-binding protein